MVVTSRQVEEDCWTHPIARQAGVRHGGVQAYGRTLRVSRSLEAAAMHSRSSMSAVPRRPPAACSAACSSRCPQRIASASGVAPVLSSAFTSMPCAVQ